jgi:hypothetical protein
MRRSIVLGVAALALAASAGPLSAAEAVAAKTASGAETVAAKTAAADSSAKTYTLRYRFQQGETLRWKVIQRIEITTAVSGTRQTVSTVVQSVKAWRIKNVREDGTATFENLVESVDMHHQFSGAKEVRYNSQTDKKPPHGFEDTAQRVGVWLALVTMNSRGEIQSRQRNTHLKAAAGENEGPMTVPLPAQPVAVGQAWSLPVELAVPLSGGIVKKIKTMQKFKLASVDDGVATIELNTVILTPIHDPSIEVQLIQRDSSSTIRFDIEAGRVIGQQVDVDKRVVGFRGEASSMHYLARANEEALGESTPPAVVTASATAASPEVITRK